MKELSAAGGPLDLTFHPHVKLLLLRWPAAGPCLTLISVKLSATRAEHRPVCSADPDGVKELFAAAGPHLGMAASLAKGFGV